VGPGSSGSVHAETDGQAARTLAVHWRLLRLPARCSEQRAVSGRTSGN
jgi:hypothetical protein